MSIRWHQRLFWKMFLVIWLVSLVGMGSVFLLLSNRYDKDHRLELLEARARGQAMLMLERYEDGVQDWHRLPGRRYSIPVWLFEADSKTPLMSGMHEPPRRVLKLELTTDSGRAYTAKVGLPREAFFAERLLKHLFSMQMVLILLVSALAGLVLSTLVVRPIRRLSRHVRDLHQAQDLTLRADTGLSQRRDEIGELTREFDAMVASVEQTLLAQQRLLQDVSHELRAPLARLQAAAGLIELRLDEGDPLMLRINRECERLDALISEILSFSRQQQNEQSSEFSLNGLCQELQEEVRLRQPERPFSLEMPVQTVVYRGPRELLRRALQNGIENVLRHTSDTTAASLVLKVLPDQAVQLSVCDRGPGVVEELLPRLFEPFVRDESLGSEGFGLGMSIARRAVEQMGGKIKALNRPEGGFELRIQLPPAS